MLFLVTCADLAAVGPDVLNSWKVEVLSELYVRASRRLCAAAGGAVDDASATASGAAWATADAGGAKRSVVRAAAGGACRRAS